MFDYHSSQTRTDRLRALTDRCRSAGRVLSLASLVVDGKVRDPSDTTQHMSTPFLDGDDRSIRVYIFAVGLTLEIRMAEDGDRAQPGSVKHETLFSNEPVLAAGEICIRAGVIEAVNDKSGSYGTYGFLATDPEVSRAVLDAIESAGAALAPSEKARLELLCASLSKTDPS